MTQGKGGRQHQVSSNDNQLLDRSADLSECNQRMMLTDMSQDAGNIDDEYSPHVALPQHNPHLGKQQPITPAFANALNPKGANQQHHTHEDASSNLCCQVCFLEQTGGLAKMCPSVEGSLRDLVH